MNDVYAKKQSQQGRNIIIRPYVFSLALGMSVEQHPQGDRDLATEELSHRAHRFPRRHAVGGSRCSRSASRAATRPRHGCKVHTRVLNQDSRRFVAELERLVLVPKQG